MIDITSLVKTYESMFLKFLFEYKLEFFAAFVLLFVGRKVFRASKGGRYTKFGLILSPLLYLAFTGFTFIGLDLIGLLACFVAFAVGLGFSGVLKDQLTFFERNGQLYYRRAVTTVLGWTVAFVLRLYLFIFYDVTVGIILSMILSYIAGLFTGEAFQIAIHKQIFDYNKSHMAALQEQDAVSEGQYN